MDLWWWMWTTVVCDKQNKFRICLRIFMTVSTYHVLHTECNSSVLAHFLCCVSYCIKHSFITHFHFTPPQKCFQTISEKGKKNRRKHCNPAAIFLVVVERWTALATNTAERLSLIKLSLTQKQVVLCLPFRYVSGFSLHFTLV